MNFCGRLLVICGLAAALCACGANSLTGGQRVGTAAPKIRTKTLADVGGDFSKITTYRQPDARMYKYSLDKALAMDKTIVLEFATPGHCTVCDDQLQILKALIDKYQKQVIFMHMDQYENPEAYVAYDVKGDPWTFIIDNKGIVRYQMAGRVLYGEMDAEIQNVLQSETEKAAG
jgi:Thioredoxin